MQISSFAYSWIFIRMWKILKSWYIVRRWRNISPSFIVFHQNSISYVLRCLFESSKWQISIILRKEINKNTSMTTDSHHPDFKPVFFYNYQGKNATGIHVLIISQLPLKINQHCLYCKTLKPVLQPI